jgi:hypothetical protein
MALHEIVGAVLEIMARVAAARAGAGALKQQSRDFATRC